MAILLDDEPRPLDEATRGVLDLLLDCHARIRRYTAVALRLAEDHPGTPEQIAEAAEATARYFGEALPLHAADEDRSLAPRLVRHREALAALAAMSAEHRAIHGVVDELMPRWRRLAASPECHAEERAALAAGADRLHALFERHLRSEEERVFPFIEAVISAEDQAIVVAEMRARRASR